VDENADYFRCPVEKGSRSWMNAVFRLPTEDLEKQFLEEAKGQGLGGLKGHRSVGGIRVSMYNAMPLEGVRAVVDFMRQFHRNHG
jgi:phosphoserine aminotransferase